MLNIRKENPMDEALRAEIQRILRERRMIEIPSLYDEEQQQAFIESVVRKAFEKHVLEPNGQTWADLGLDAEETQPA